MSKKFIHLHNHTMFSLLDGACRLDELCIRAHELGMPAVAITDHGNMFGALDFYEAAKKIGIHPIIGQEFYVAPGSRHERKEIVPGIQSGYHLTVIAANNTGYSNLMKLSSIGYLEGFYYKPRIDMEILEKYSDGLFVLSGCLKGEIPHRLLKDDLDGAREVARWFLQHFGVEHFFIELMDHGIDAEKQVLPLLVQLAKEMGIRMVATNDVHYIHPEDADFHDKMLCIQMDKTVDDPDRMRFDGNEFYLKSSDEMTALFSEIPEALDNTLWIAERADVEIETGKMKLPKFPIPPGFDDVDQYLDTKAREGLVHRYDKITKRIEERLEYELDVIKKMGFSSYFAIVADFTDNARKLDVWIGPGRGSGAGSLVAYSLKITNIDPLKYDLLFERFLNPERVSMPDFDIDFDDQHRDRVIKYSRDRYGEDAVCQIITFNCLKARAAIKDVARIYNLTFKEANSLTALVPEGPNVTIDNALQVSPQLAKLYNENDTYRNVINYARKLEGFPRNAGVHAAGVVITPGPLVNYVPLYRSAKKETTTQFDKDQLEKIGLLKMDFLGLTTLSILREAILLIEKDTGDKIDLDMIPFNSSDVFEIFAQGNTTGVFQFESEGMRRYLKQLEPDSLDDLIAMNALYRPGPMQFIERYISCKHGREKVSYPHPDVEDVLKNTYGIALYQEQVMQLARRLAGYSLGEADLLRRAIGKKKAEIMVQQRDSFQKKAVKKGLSGQLAREVFEIIEAFAGYGFPKAHSTAYAIIAYQTAYLKCRYPREFIAANLTFAKSEQDVDKFLRECKRLEIPIYPPDVNKSFESFSVEGEGIRFGLGKIKNLGHGVIQTIVETRENIGKFNDIYHLTESVDSSVLNKKTLVSMIEAGAFDSLDIERSVLCASYELLQQWRNQLEKQEKSLSQSLFNSESVPGYDDKPRLLEIEPWSPLERLEHERSVLGVYISGHPLDHFEDELKAFSSGTIESILQSSGGKSVSVAGLLVSFRIAKSRQNNGKQTGIGVIQDTTAQIKALFYSEILERYRFILDSSALVLVEGKLKSDIDSVVLVVDDVTLLNDTRKKYCRNLHIKFSTETDTEKLEKIVGFLTEHGGRIPLQLHIATPQKTYKALSIEYSNDASSELVETIRSILDNHSVWIT